ncbi:hypothetical protein HHK36_012671 [Tetracentron sinense]|uniref:Uncharacterized protein n=1 Tax=Tetracentron sinense TaxID=13715 RepID=A0A834Z9P7_TETSI|nr:hypothetical protein HHK36_012671 [Tetracentron sinense]
MTMTCMIIPIYNSSHRWALKHATHSGVARATTIAGKTVWINITAMDVATTIPNPLSLRSAFACIPVDLTSHTYVLVRDVDRGLYLETVVPKVGAKTCDALWTCNGDNRCRQDCVVKYHGRGRCDDYTAPLVPKQCFCAYPC